jgi:hypothetical protein
VLLKDPTWTTALAPEHPPTLTIHSTHYIMEALPEEQRETTKVCVDTALRCFRW